MTDRISDAEVQALEDAAASWTEGRFAAFREPLLAVVARMEKAEERRKFMGDTLFIEPRILLGFIARLRAAEKRAGELEAGLELYTDEVELRAEDLLGDILRARTLLQQQAPAPEAGEPGPVRLGEPYAVEGSGLP